MLQPYRQTFKLLQIDEAAAKLHHTRSREKGLRSGVASKVDSSEIAPVNPKEWFKCLEMRFLFASRLAFYLSWIPGGLAHAEKSCVCGSKAVARAEKLNE